MCGVVVSLCRDVLVLPVLYANVQGVNRIKDGSQATGKRVIAGNHSRVYVTAKMMFHVIVRHPLQSPPC